MKVTPQTSCAVFMLSSVLPRGYVGIGLRRLHEKKTVIFFVSWNVSGIRVELISRIRHRLHGPKCWISLKTSTLMPQTDSLSSPPAMHICTPSSGLEPSVLVSCHICWWVQCSLYHTGRPVSWTWQSASLSKTWWNFRARPLDVYGLTRDTWLLVVNYRKYDSCIYHGVSSLVIKNA